MNIAIVGATGAVGREMLQTLSERKFPVGNVYALASKSSIGREVSFGENKVLKVSSVDNFDFQNVKTLRSPQVLCFLKQSVNHYLKCIF